MSIKNTVNSIFSEECQMEYAPLVFSLLFFIAFAVYLFFGMYIIQMDPKANTNRLFLLVCVSLCLWSFGFCFANSAPNLGVCMFWRRVSALGWGSIYSFLLHFVILLTAGKNPPKRRYLYFLTFRRCCRICFFYLQQNHRYTI